MTEPLTVARPYARAAFEIASNSELLPKWEKFLELIVSVTAHPKVREWLDEPSFDLTKKSEGLASLLGDEYQDANMKNFLILLVEKKRLAQSPEILFLYKSMKAEFEKKIPVLVKSAFPISEASLKQIAEVLQRKFNRTVDVLVEIDKTLLGGLLIESGDFVMDHSIRGRIHQLSEVLS